MSSLEGSNPSLSVEVSSFWSFHGEAYDVMAVRVPFGRNGHNPGDVSREANQSRPLRTVFAGLSYLVNTESQIGNKERYPQPRLAN